MSAFLVATPAAASSNLMWSFYEEGLDRETLERAVSYIRQADILIVGGTSLVVYPAAGLIRYYQGKKLVLINKGTTAYDQDAQLVISAAIGKVMEQLP